MRRLAIALATLVPLAALAEPPAEAPRAETQASTGPRPLAIEAGSAAPAAPDAAGHEKRPRSYVFAKAGAFVPRSADLAGFRDGLAVEVGAGARVWRFLAVEIGTGWLGASYDEYGSNTSVGGYEVTQHIHAVPVVASVRASARLHHLEGYAIAGAGLYLWSFDGKVRSTVYSPYSYYDTTTGFGAHVGAGVTAHLTRRLALGLEGRYLLAQTKFFGRTANADGVVATANAGWAF